MPISEAQRKAVAKYNAKAYDRIETKVAKGEKATIQAYVDRCGESLNGFVSRAIYNQIKRDNISTPTANIETDKPVP